MFKSIQIKIIIIFMIVGIIVITGLGAFTLYTTERLNENTVLLGEVLEQNKIIFLIGIVIYVLISVLVAYFVTKNIIKPTTKLIKSAEEFMGDSENKIDFSGAKVSNEIDGLANAFSIMT
ncbi:MAG: hypothetical protein LBL91_06400, partial [Lachnospiraceae bacterium]|nr:hypothetical protein [Lachnospiraceae bacterium]